MRYGDLASSVTTDLALEDIGIKVKRRANNAELVGKMQELLSVALQQGADPNLVKAIAKSYMETDASEMMSMIEKSMDNMIQQQQAAQQAQAQQQAAMMQQNQAMNAQQQQQMGQQSADNELRNLLAQEAMRQQGQQGQSR
jgi:hypothetical protein